MLQSPITPSDERLEAQAAGFTRDQRAALIQRQFAQLAFERSIRRLTDEEHDQRFSCMARKGL